VVYVDDVATHLFNTIRQNEIICDDEIFFQAQTERDAISEA
jgi:hypothetical protein